MLGEIEEDLAYTIGIDTIGLPAPGTMFGFRNENWKEFQAPWEQDLLVPGKFNAVKEPNGDLLMYPDGDTTVPPSARMPSGGFFFDAVVRQEPLDKRKLNVEDNMEKFQPFTEADLAYFEEQAELISASERAVVGNIGGIDVGTQTSTFCSTDTFQNLFPPYYKKINSWIHENTNWKTFKHSRGAVEPIIPLRTECCLPGRRSRHTENPSIWKRRGSSQRGLG